MDNSQNDESGDKVAYKSSAEKSSTKTSTTMAANVSGEFNSNVKSTTRAEILFEQLIDDIELMSQFARNNGKQLSDHLVDNISELLESTSSIESGGQENE